jgi:uncharacterized membrane protein
VTVVTESSVFYLDQHADAAHWRWCCSSGALIVGLGVILAALLFLRALLARQTADFNAIRLTLAHYLALALEFQLGADILSTAVTPSWTEIGKL